MTLLTSGLLASSVLVEQCENESCQRKSKLTRNVEELFWLESTTLIFVDFAEVLVQLLQFLFGDYQTECMVRSLMEIRRMSACDSQFSVGD